jgi:ribosome biogenesis GTPase
LGSPRDDQYLEYADYDENLPAGEARTRKPKPKRVSAGLVRGIVVRARGHHYDVRILDGRDSLGEERMCEVRGRLLQERGRDTLVAVGDFVWIAAEGKHGGRIERVEDRHSVLSRQHPGVAVPAEDVILANPDQALVVFALAEPEPHLRMLDRFLVIAEANELPAVICANKVDLTGGSIGRDPFAVYERIGYQVIFASAETGEGLDQVRNVLAGRLTVLAGPSGVGKSSLLKAIDPALDVRIGDLREALQKGKHTTRAARIYAMAFAESTYVADTPGIRELGLYEIDEQNLSFYFREFVAYLHDCRYPSCTHDHEPGCAIRDAVAAGKIDPARYDSYLRLIHGEE